MKQKLTDKKLDILLMHTLRGHGGPVANPGCDDAVGRTLALSNYLVQQGDPEAGHRVVRRMINIYKDTDPEMYDQVKHLA